MAVPYDLQTLVQRTKRMEGLPTGQTAFLDTDIVDFLNTELQTVLVPLHMRINEEFFVKTVDMQFSANSTVNAVNIPFVGVGFALRDVYFADTTNTVNPSFYNVPRLQPEMIASLGPSTSWNVGNPVLYGFFIQGNALQFFPNTLLQNKQLRLTYFRRPADLVLPSSAAQITAINTGLNQVTVNNMPTGWATGTIVDAINPIPDFDYVINQTIVPAPYTTPTPLVGITIAGVTGLNITLPAGAITSLEVGDWLSEDGTSPFVQYAPVESYQLLCQLGAIRCLRALNDTDAEKMAINKYKEMMENYLFMTTPRIEGKPKTFNNTNGILSASRPTSLRPLN